MTKFRNEAISLGEWIKGNWRWVRWVVGIGAVVLVVWAVVFG